MECAFVRTLTLFMKWCNLILVVDFDELKINIVDSKETPKKMLRFSYLVCASTKNKKQKNCKWVNFKLYFS